MQTMRRIARPVVHIIVFGLLALGIHMPAANAALVGTEAVIDAQRAHQDRSRIRALLGREEVKAGLLARGVDPADVQARVDNLTDREVQTLAAKMDQLPAGGDVLGVAVFVFLVLLITDILGFTDIFPFVKKPARR